MNGPRYGEIARPPGDAWPISVEGRLWGVMIVASTHEDAFAAGTEHRLAEFTELVATTIANAQAREELSTLAAAEDLRDRASIAWVAVALAAEQVADGAGR
jgi:GAF domain-containing protein